MKTLAKINIIFEDEDLIIVDKTAGITSIPDRFKKEELCISSYLKTKYPEVFVVHRLDRDTSGVMVFCKNAESHRNLNMQFDSHDVIRKYHVVVSGIVQENEMSIDIPIIENPSKKGQSMPSARGKESLTVIKVLNRHRIATLLECALITGRHHQIRVHCAAIGHPLIVDPIYGNLSDFKLSTIKRRYNLRKNEVEKPIISRVSVHSKSLGFTHPSTNEKVMFESVYPKDFSALIQVLEKYSSLPDYGGEQGFGRYFQE